MVLGDMRGDQGLHSGPLCPEGERRPWGESSVTDTRAPAETPPAPRHLGGRPPEVAEVGVGGRDIAQSTPR